MVLIGYQLKNRTLCHPSDNYLTRVYDTTVDSIPVLADIWRSYGRLLADLYGGLVVHRESTGDADQSITRKGIRRRVVLSFLRWDSIGGYRSICLTRQTFSTSAVDIRVQSCSWVTSESLLFCLISRKRILKTKWILKSFVFLWFFCSLRAIATPQHLYRLSGSGSSL